MITLFTALTFILAALLFICLEIYLIRSNQEKHFKQSQENWNSLIETLKELGRYGE
jgi:preprotein translocase subunit YajC